MLKISLFVMIIFSLNACTKKSEEPMLKEIIIGEFSALTGPQSSFGKSAHQGIQLAVEEVNAAGGVKGIPIRVVTIDNKGLDEKVEESVRSLHGTHKALALVGEVSSGRSLVAAKIAQELRIPLISPTATAVSVTNVGDYVFRACYIDPFQARVMAKFALENLKVKKVAVLRDIKSEYSQGLAEHFIQYFESAGGKVVAEDQFSNGDIGFADQINHVRASRPDAIYIPGYYPEAGKLARQIRKMGVKSILLGSDGWDSERLFKIGKDAVNGSYFTNHFSIQNNTPNSQKFVSAFRKKYSQSPNGLAAMGYDAAQLLFNALKRAKKLDRENIKAALTATRDFTGVTGHMTFDSKRNAVKPIVIVKVDGPVNRFVTSMKPEDIPEPAAPKESESQEPSEQAAL